MAAPVCIITRPFSRHSGRAFSENMTALTEFSLKKHPGPYESWPLKSRLLRNGEPTSLLLPGYSLLHQFRTEHGFLFITNYDCPMEEVTEFTLCNSKLRRISVRFVGCPYDSFTLQRVEWIDERHLMAVFDQNDPWLVTIRRWSIPYFRPRLTVRRMKSPNEAPHATATAPGSCPAYETRTSSL
jgi:hypothetical protein